MATPLDIGLLRQFDVIFPFLLVFVLVYAGLGFMKAFKDNKALHALLALVLSFLTLFSPLAIRTINIMSPLFVILMIFILFALMIFMTLGPSESDVLNALKSKEYQFTWWWILAFILLIGFGSFFKAVVETQGSIPGYSSIPGTGGSPGTSGSTSPAAPSAGGPPIQGAPGQEADFFKTLFHPKVLGLVFIMLLGLFTINRLASAGVE